MMQVWHFSEMAYHPGWESLPDGLRNVIPSRVYDPQIGADLYHRYLDEWALCDRLGLNIMVNEHHATATCTTSVCTIPMAILARETQTARLLCLGMPIGNRMDAVRVAEEYAMLDVISRGRVEMGFVKGAPFEINPANSNPAALEERFWEAHDLIVKALTTHDGPFNWEGRHYHYREVNVWPRPWQQPHPPIWMTVASPGSASRIARKGYVIAALNTGYIHTPVVYGAYRESAAEAGIATGPDRFAYLCIVGVGARAVAVFPSPRLFPRRPDRGHDPQLRTPHPAPRRVELPDAGRDGGGLYGRRRRLRRHAGAGGRASRRVRLGRRRLRAPADDGPGRLPEPRGHSRQPNPVLRGSAAGDSRAVARRPLDGCRLKAQETTDTTACRRSIRVLSVPTAVGGLRILRRPYFIIS